MSATWTSKRPEFEIRLKNGSKELLHGVTDLAHYEILVGSGLTGSPGQPDDLREGQWEVTKGDDEATIGTNDPSARSVEDGISHKYGGPITLNSPRGGSHSVKLTHQNADKLIAAVVKRIRGKG